MSSLGLYDLLASQLLLGAIPDFIDKYLSKLGVDELRTSVNNLGIVYTGRATFTGDGGAAPVRQHSDPSGAVFNWDDISIDFRLTVPRSGAQFLADAVGAVGGAGAVNAEFQQMQNLFALFGSVPAPPPPVVVPPLPTDYPGVSFQLEILFSAITFHLGKSWVPGKVEGFRIVPDLKRDQEDVKIVLPKVVFEYTQDNQFTPIALRVKSWGNSGFDAPNDLAEGELVRMEPAIALHESGRFAFSVGEIVLDLSVNNTPPEILEFFGEDASFQGLFFKSVRFYYSDKSKDTASNLAIQDVLISFAGQVSLEVAVTSLFGSELEMSVHLFDQGREKSYLKGQQGINETSATKGKATLSNTGVIQVHVENGNPGAGSVPFPITVTLDGTPIWDDLLKAAPISQDPNNLRQPKADPRNNPWTVSVSVSDASGQTKTETIDLIILAAEASSLPPSGKRQPAQLIISTPPPGYQLLHQPSSSGTDEILTVLGGTNPPSILIDGNSFTPTAQRQVSVQVLDGASLNIQVDYQPSQQSQETFSLFFDNDKPKIETWDASKASYVVNTPNPPDFRFISASNTPSATPGKLGADALRDWVQNRLGSQKSVSIDAHASFEPTTSKDHDQKLSERRREVAIAIVQSIPGVSVTISGGTAQGHQEAQQANRKADENDRVAKITGSVVGQPAVTIKGTISRPPLQTNPGLPQIVPAPDPPLAPTKKPSFLKRFGFRVRVERNVVVLAEISGEVDFETALEKTLNSATNSNNKLGLKPQKNATQNPNPADGVVDFLLDVTYDPATHSVTETLMFGAAPADQNGLLQMTNTEDNALKDIFGALLIFAPIANSPAALNPVTSGDWVTTAIDLGLPIAVGDLKVLRTHTATFYGGELRSRQHIPPGNNPAQFDDFGVVFDYGVEFGIVIDALGISTTQPLRVRYKAIGFNLNFNQGTKYQPIFDTSKGYELDLSDPGIFKLPGALGDLLKILKAKLSRINPLTLDVDLGLKVDLGVVTVDQFKIKWVLEKNQVPMILPAGIHLNIPSILTGSGYLNIVDTKDSQGNIVKGIEGAIDITLVPIKLRIAATVSVLTFSQGNRTATAVFVALTVEFPSPIVLAATGMGIFGFSGLFAMHYKRKEPALEEGKPAPALRWLDLAKADPTKLKNNQNVPLWEPELDRWSFGVGMVLGTLEGGTLINLRGMVILELPGPRLLILIKMQIITDLPQLSDKDDVSIGILGIVDLDFHLEQLTIGVIVDFTLPAPKGTPKPGALVLLQVKLPIELFFKLNNLKKWHLWLGNNKQPASAKILGAERARGYFMIDGDKIDDFPTTGKFLPGIAVAVGIAVPLIYGWEDLNIYLKVAAEAELGVSFSPFFILGKLAIVGELRFIIISLEASAELDFEAPPVHLHGFLEASVHILFFEVSAKLELEIGEQNTEKFVAEPLVRNLYLQSYAPVLLSGQGGDRPIDGSLGDAILLDSEGKLPTDKDGKDVAVPVVPIDSVPVIQFLTPPLVESFDPYPQTNPPTPKIPTATFTESLDTCPVLTQVTQNPDGWLKVGGGREVHYSIQEIILDPPLPTTSPKPPVTWRWDQPKDTQNATNVELALFSRIPTVASLALERSSELKDQVTEQWKGLCDEIAPPSVVLWTFCGVPLDTSSKGWQLTGKPHPDPPGTTRSSQPPTQLTVEVPQPNYQEKWVNAPARVVGFNSSQLPCRRALQLPYFISSENGLKPLSQSWVIFHTGAASSVTLLIKASRRLVSDGHRLFVLELDANDQLVKETAINDLPSFTLSNLQELANRINAIPADWSKDVLEVGTFLFKDEHPREEFGCWFIAIEPSPLAAKLKLIVLPTPNNTEPDRIEPDPRVIVGAVFVGSLQESDRVAKDLEIQTTQLQNLGAYLSDRPPVPLLEPNQTYKLTVKYSYQSRLNQKLESTQSDQVQTFKFQTDANAPARLDPWVLGTTPNADEKYHFCNDLVQVIFNDNSTLQLFAAYKKKLQVVIRAADGKADTEALVVQAVPGTFSTPYRDALIDLVQSGGLPCYTLGESRTHTKYTSQIQLRPLMSYILDIEAVDVSSGATPTNPSIITPLYRRFFTTSRFATIADLVEELKAKRIRHRCLNQAVKNLPTPATPEQQNAKEAIAPDEVLQKLLTDAGEQALPAPSDTGITIYWVKQTNNIFKPHAILIDASEPLWRRRTEATLVTVPDQEDEAFQQIVSKSLSALQITEEITDTSVVQRFVHSPAGTRTLVLLTDTLNLPADGKALILSLSRLASTNPAYGITAQKQNLPEILLTRTAPWQEDFDE